MAEIDAHAPPPPPAPVASTNDPSEVLEVRGNEAVSPRDAARLLAQYRWNRDGGDQYAVEPTPPDTPPAAPARALQPPQDTAQAESPAPAEEATGEVPTEAAEPPTESAPLELPRSWSKDQAERWAKLPPETQAYLLEQDSKSTKAVRSAQNESAEQRKALDAERQKMEQARQQYEQALPQLLQALQQQQMGDFADIKTQADVEKMAREDWPRYALFDAKQKQLQAIHNEMQQSQQRQQTEFRKQWDEFASKEDAKFLEAAPELKDTKVSEKTRTAALAYLKDIGFSDQDLSKSWNGENSWSPRDSRVQLLIRDAVRYREAQAAARTKAVKPVPTVQRPGSPVARAPDVEVNQKRLSDRLDNSGHWKDAAELLIARRNASRGR